LAAGHAIDSFDGDHVTVDPDLHWSLPSSSAMTSSCDRAVRRSTGDAVS